AEPRRSPSERSADRGALLVGGGIYDRPLFQREGGFVNRLSFLRRRSARKGARRAQGPLAAAIIPVVEEMEVRVLLAANPTFRSPTTGAAPVDTITLPFMETTQMVTGDFNHDGRPDIAVVDKEFQQIQVLYGTGNQNGGPLLTPSPIVVNVAPAGPIGQIAAG